jgi:PTH1 family peptidyl-tRNA hydrolase
MNSLRVARYRLIVGLGNPGKEYEQTRHNVGFMVLDRLAQGRGEWRKQKAWRGEVCEAQGVWLLKPQTYMNLSGESVRAMSDFYKIAPESVLVVLDDLSLGLGQLRLRLGGSAGGHNGLKSILEHLGTRDVARVRVGIGGAGPGEVVGHVLGKFRKDEWPRVEEALERTEAAIHRIQSDGMERAMNAFN